MATEASTELFRSEYLRNLREAEGEQASAGGFHRLEGDEIEALILAIFLRDLSAQMGVRVTLRDDDNPLAKLRHLEFSGGRLPSGNELEELLARRPVMKKVHGQSIAFYPPAHRLSVHPASKVGAWGYGLLGLRAYAPTLLEAESEALKYLNAVRRLGS
ncbi:MAG TPA: hypothetical protein VNL71_20040 [Chloroflexota bacterium]|nr:hypothetical protein [Chloroflexota bacterium]